MKRRALTVVLSVVALFAFLSDLHAEVINGYLVPAVAFKKAASIANLLLKESIPVYRATQPFTVDGKTYEQGDYIVSIPDDAVDFSDDIARAYVRYVAAKLDVQVFPFSGSFSTNAYRLQKTNAAIYFGQGTSAGALWHVNAAEQAKFGVGLLLETDVQQNDFQDFNAIVFPSGGFYSGYLGEAGNNNVREFVRAGNGFHGTCGGSVYGTELGLLDVTQDMEAGWPAAADLRGPISLSNEAAGDPVLFSVGAVFNPLYWSGQNFDYVGPEVTVLARYAAPTPDLVPYDPAISRAYGYYPNTEIINRFWGRPAAVRGMYENGKVVLIGPHPEYFPETQTFTVNTQDLPALGEIESLEPVGPTHGTVDMVALLRKIVHIKNLTISAREQLAGLETENEQITDAVGEFLVSFLDDQITRSTHMTADALKAAALGTELNALKSAIEIRRHRIPDEQYTIAKNRIEFAQSLIVDFLTKLNDIDSLNTPAEQVVQELTQHRQSLTDLLSLKDREGESEAFYAGVIALYSSENDTLHTVKLETAYPVLKLSFEASRMFENAEFANVLALKVLEN
jgi:hypothetical protein